MEDGEPVGTRDRASGRTATLWWLIWILWIPLFIPVTVGFLQTHPSAWRVALSLGGAILFFGIYAWSTRQCAAWLAGSGTPVPRDALAHWRPVVLMLALAGALTLWDGSSWGTLFIYACTGAAGWLTLWEAVAVVAAVVLFEAQGLRNDPASAANAITFTVIPAAIIIALMRSVKSAQQLREAREEIASLAAVTEERLRIARDLHDLLGHNLSVIALKSELARKLIAGAPERAAVEIGDVEAVARSALREVREAVAGYRQPSLSGEMAGAREVLAAAGIACKQAGDASLSARLPAAADAALAWVLREGVTNVIRHGSARTCTIRLEHTRGEITLEITNDVKRGAGSAVVGTSVAGNGLRGAAERMKALGGCCESGPTGYGFRLRATIPIGERSSGQADGNGPPTDAPPHVLAPALEQVEEDRQA
jgi:two-component system, NarL family, sensor histidine kinase DesK